MQKVKLQSYLQSKLWACIRQTLEIWTKVTINLKKIFFLLSLTKNTLIKQPAPTYSKV